MNVKELYKYQNVNLAILIIRLWLGTIMLKHSTSYLLGGKINELAGFLDGLGWPMPELMAYSSQIVEVITSIMIMLGLRVGAVILAFNMSIAVVFAHKFLIYTEGELAFGYFTFALILSLVGCGKPALDNLLFKK